MRALTIWQPWAGAITLGWKPVENRGWTTPHRGLLAIHGGARLDDAGVRDPRMAAAVEAELRAPSSRLRDAPGPIRDEKPFTRGAVVAVAELVGCHWATPGCCSTPWANTDSPAHWVLANPFPLPDPVPCAGRQRLWLLPGDVAEAVAEQAREVYW